MEKKNIGSTMDLKRKIWNQNRMEEGKTGG